MTQVILGIIAHLEQNRCFSTYYKDDNNVFLMNEGNTIRITVSRKTATVSPVFKIVVFKVSTKDIAALQIESISEMETILNICNRYLDKGSEKPEPVKQTLLHLDPNIVLPDTINGTETFCVFRSGMVLVNLKDSVFGVSLATYLSNGIWELYSPYLDTSGQFTTKDIEYWAEV